MNIPQTSASGRTQAAQRALEAFENATPEKGKNDIDRYALALEMADALRALIAPPSVGESQVEIANRIGSEVASYGLSLRGTADFAALMGIKAGIQSAHETWEPADHPSQEMMLRWLGIDYEDSIFHKDQIFIEPQFIEREVI